MIRPSLRPPPMPTTGLPPVEGHPLGRTRPPGTAWRLWTRPNVTVEGDSGEQFRLVSPGRSTQPTTGTCSSWPVFLLQSYRGAGTRAPASPVPWTFKFQNCDIYLYICTLWPPRPHCSAQSTSSQRYRCFRIAQPRHPYSCSWPNKLSFLIVVTTYFAEPLT